MKLRHLPWLHAVLLHGLLLIVAAVAGVSLPSALSESAPAHGPWSRSSAPSPASTSSSLSMSSPAPAEEPSLRGLWSRYPESDGHDDSPVSFYYFHSENIGLYRYGYSSYNSTNSYHWSLRNQVLTLRWNKTGEVNDLAIRIEWQAERPVLVVDHDPKNPTEASTRYTFQPAPLSAAGSADLFPWASEPRIGSSSSSQGIIDHRLWIDLKQYATGGLGFSLWQLRAQGIDGRGTGWFHQGDFDDWTTEQLTYKALATSPASGQLDVTFPRRREHAVTAFTVVREGDARLLRLHTDPRDFGALHSYVDAGPSFASPASWH
jgi:hypothetical protein